MNKFIRDTTMVHGRYAQKKVLTFMSFFVASIYVFTPLIKESFEVKEFVFLGFLAIGGFSIYRAQKIDENTRVSNDASTHAGE